MVKIGNIMITGDAYPLPHKRADAKAVLRGIAKGFGVPNVYFVRATKANYGGYFNLEKGSIVVVEKHKSRYVPMYTIVYRFLHELTHHLHRETGIFKAYYYEYTTINGKKKKHNLNDIKRVALRAEKHANLKAIEMADEFFGMILTATDYTREYLEESRPDIFGK